MATIAVYSGKGGVGKTTLAVSLAWASATRSCRQTLLWDLDAQAAASFILARSAAPVEAREVIEREVAPAKAIVPTAVPHLELLPADASIRSLDSLFATIGRKKRLLRVLGELGGRYDHILLDCPPGLGITGDQAIRAADLIVLPLIPSTLSRRVYEQVRLRLGRERRHCPIVLPVFTLADRRRAAHRAAFDAEPDWPVIPMASAVEEMADRRAAIGEYAPRTPAAAAISALWTAIERRLA